MFSEILNRMARKCWVFIGLIVGTAWDCFRIRALSLVENSRDETDSTKHAAESPSVLCKNDSWSLWNLILLRLNFKNTQNFVKKTKIEDYGGKDEIIKERL